MNNEEWRVIPEFEQYSISSHGRVKHNKTGHVRKNKFDANTGYLRICFHVTRTTVKTFSIHRLVADAFVDKIGKPQVNHIDGNKENNHVSNLEWVTAKENSAHAIRTGLGCVGEKNGQSKLTTQNVIDIKRFLTSGKLSGSAIARMFSVTPRSIRLIKLGETWRNVK